MRKIWNGINEIINVKSKVFNSPSTIKSKGKTISDPKEIATSFNTYFTNIAEDIIKKRKYNGRISHKKYLTEPLDKSLVLYDFDVSDVAIAISTLNPRKGSYPNPVNIRRLKTFFYSRSTTKHGRKQTKKDVEFESLCTHFRRSEIYRP